MTVTRIIKKIIKAILPYGIVVCWKRRRYRKSIIFFRKNSRKVQAIAELLADERSKEVYLGVIKARCGLAQYSDFYTTQVQYFQNDFFKYGENEVLIDCGAYDGNTINDFIKFVPNYKGIISFEATPATFEFLKKNHENNSKIQLINKGVWSETTKLTFYEISGYNNAANRFTFSPKMGEFHAITIDTISIDALELQEKVTLIKMDIEGAELEALKGAKKTILRDKPKLAICLYHSDEDMIRIAEYVHEIVPEYKLYVRHHWINGAETVLYGCM